MSDAGQVRVHTGESSHGFVLFLHLLVVLTFFLSSDLYRVAVLWAGVGLLLWLLPTPLRSFGGWTCAFGVTVAVFIRWPEVLPTHVTNFADIWASYPATTLTEQVVGIISLLAAVQYATLGRSDYLLFPLVGTLLLKLSGHVGVNEDLERTQWLSYQDEQTHEPAGVEVPANGLIQSDAPAKVSHQPDQAWMRLAQPAYVEPDDWRVYSDPKPTPRDTYRKAMSEAPSQTTAAPVATGSSQTTALPTATPAPPTSDSGAVAVKRAGSSPLKPPVAGSTMKGASRNKPWSNRLERKRLTQQRYDEQRVQKDRSGFVPAASESRTRLRTHSIIGIFACHGPLYKQLFRGWLRRLTPPLRREMWNRLIQPLHHQPVLAAEPKPGDPARLSLPERNHEPLTWWQLLRCCSNHGEVKIGLLFHLAGCEHQDIARTLCKSERYVIDVISRLDARMRERYARDTTSAKTREQISRILQALQHHARKKRQPSIRPPRIRRRQIREKSKTYPTLPNNPQLRRAVRELIWHIRAFTALPRMTVLSFVYGIPITKMSTEQRLALAHDLQLPIDVSAWSRTGLGEVKLCNFLRCCRTHGEAVIILLVWFKGMRLEQVSKMMELGPHEVLKVIRKVIDRLPPQSDGDFCGVTAPLNPLPPADHGYAVPYAVAGHHDGHNEPPLRFVM